MKWIENIPYLLIKFEYDPAKRDSDLAKNGIDFDKAQSLWFDQWLLEAPARTEDEPRFLSIGRIGGTHWTAIWTPRGDAVRIISVRRARAEEVDYYEGN